MTWLHKLVRHVWGRLYHWLIPPYRTIRVNEALPEQLKQRTVYVVQEDGFEEQVAMLCPCGCRHVLHMNLLSDDRPYWHLAQNPDGTVTLHPSVWRMKDCGSHFWFRRGRVQWCRDEDEAEENSSEIGNATARALRIKGGKDRRPNATVRQRGETARKATKGRRKTKLNQRTIHPH